ncbi:stage III sporulation protein AA [uncultured Tyzzerella sp.]|uniref:stage III sporulation protein AA n=1 Tax=uncultured Tyzzerella sp. TaxID=2321398 RepID=UPI002941D10C|nr:stage III sporulation protein AA [uncultured Tyzzerella sp.]
MFIKDKLINYFGKNIKFLLNNIDYQYFEKSEEVRIRLDRCIVFKTFDKEYFLLKDMTITENFLENKVYKPTIEDISQTIETMSGYSIYALEQELKNGFITLNGGFRVGITGKVITENNKVKTIRNISSINIRIAREIKGCSSHILKYISNPTIKSTIIISPPNCGKTTLLRDIIRNISNCKENVGLVDERSEIASLYMGKTQLDVGIRTDVLDRCKKSDGMLMLLRSMSPSVIAVDEIGSDEDIEAIEKIANSGVKIICTIHSYSIDDIKQKYNMQNILNNKIFERYIVLNRKNEICNVEKIYNENMEVVYGEDN